VQSAGAINTMQLNWTTTDPQLGAPTVLNIYNMQAGGDASALAGLSPVPVTSSAQGATGSISVTGNLLDLAMVASPITYEFIPAGAGIILPAGAANGLLLSTVVTSAGTSYSMTFRWVEY